MTEKAASVQGSRAPLLFLSHAGEESEAARALAAALRGAGVEVWLDVDRLRPGDRWQHEIGAALRRSQALLLYVGRTAVDRWVDFEVQIALDRAAKNGNFRLIPVLGPGADPDALPDFVKLFHGLDLRHDIRPAPEKLKDLLTVLLNKPAERIAVLPPDRPPFRGLLHFDVEDAVVFFGRERETEELLGHLGKDPFLLVVGDSGCGKSSLVRAGLVPALLRGRFHDGRAWVSDWRIAITRPGNDPFGELAESLPDLAGDASDRPERIHRNRTLLAEGSDGLRDIVAGSVSPGSRTLLVVDQFEELFTYNQEPDNDAAAVRRRYIDCLLRAANAEGSRPVHVIVTLRADFFGRCWESPELLDRIQQNQYLTPRLPVERLRELIERPLAMAGAQAEPGLVETMLDDVGDEPSNLALLEHTLDQLWQKRRVDGEGLWITHEAYESMGRLPGALRNHANAAVERLKSEEERTLARRFFVDLTQLGEGTEDTRRRVKIEDLTALTGDRDQAIAVLEKLASERLITTGEDHAEVAHEALIRSWPELRKWVDADRDFVRHERRLLEDAKEWQRLGRDREALLRGARLVEAETWLASAPRVVPLLLRELIEASTAEREGEDNERERHRQAELSRLRTAAAIFVVLAMGLAYFWWAAHDAGRTALARGLAAQAQLIEIKNPELVETWARLAAESMRWQRLPESQSSLRRALKALGKPIVWFEHKAEINSVAFSPDGQRAVSGGIDHTARVWDATTRKEMARFKHKAPVRSVSFSPDGQRVVSGSADRTARVWEAATGREIASFEHGDIVTSVAFSPDGRHVASGSLDNTARVWDAATGKEIARFEVEYLVTAVAFSPDGRRVANGSFNRVQVWEPATGQEIMRIEHGDFVTAVGFSPDGQRVVTGSRKEFVPEERSEARIWDAVTGKEIMRFEHRGSVAAVAFSPDGQQVVSGSWDNTARVWETATGEEVARVEHGRPVNSVAFSPDGRRVVSGSSDGTARVWEVALQVRRERPVAPQAVARYGEAAHAFTWANFSPDWKRIVSSHADNTVRVLEAATGKEILRVKHGAIASVALSPAGKRVASGGWNGTVRVWDVGTGRQIARFDHDAAVTSVTFSPDGQRVVSSGSSLLQKRGEGRVWDVATGKEIARIGHGALTSPVAFSPDGKRIVSGCRDGTVRVWNVGTGREIGRFRPNPQIIISVAFSPDGKRVVSGGLDRAVQIWDVATGQEIAQFEHGARVSSVAFSPDGQRVVSGNGFLPAERGEARVWDVATGQEIARVEHRGPIKSVAFSPDGRWLATVSGNSIDFHAIRSEDLLEQVCGRLWRNFTPEEWKRYLPGKRYRKTCPNLPLTPEHKPFQSETSSPGTAKPP